MSALLEVLNLKESQSPHMLVLKYNEVFFPDHHQFSLVIKYPITISITLKA